MNAWKMLSMCARIAAASALRSESSAETKVALKVNNTIASTRVFSDIILSSNDRPQRSTKLTKKAITNTRAVCLLTRTVLQRDWTSDTVSQCDCLLCAHG